MNHGFIKVAVAVPEVKVADCEFNGSRILEMIKQADSKGVEIVCFPELSITAYTCGDLFFQQTLLDSAKRELFRIVENTAGLNIVGIVGLPVRWKNKLFNVAAVFSRGQILGMVPKTYLPNYNEFYEQRWFASSTEADCGLNIGDDLYPFATTLLFGNDRVKFAVEICEDLWVPNPPSSTHCLEGAHLIFNLSASNELTGKNDYRRELVNQQAARCMAGYVYAGAGWGESTTDLVFAGNALISENGTMLCESERFLFEEQLIVADIDVDRLQNLRNKNTSFRNSNTDYLTVSVDFKETQTEVQRKINPHPFVIDRNLSDIFSIQVGGLAKRLMHTGIKNMVLGISGGLDSTLALLVCIKTCEKLKLPMSHVIGVTMPGFGTGKRTLNNALRLMKETGITGRKIDIGKVCLQHFKDIGHDPDVHDITYENTQARERTQILMDIANQCNGLVIGTGDLSELALGWATYNGDHISMYAVNVGIPKTLVKHLVDWAATQLGGSILKTLNDIVATPVSPELLPVSSEKEFVQPTEEIVGPYELHDFFLYYLLRLNYTPTKIFFMAKIAFIDKYAEAEILKWMKVFYRRFFAQQFKRSCLPDGPKVGSINLSPRGDWRMPSDACVKIWMNEIDRLE